MESILKIIAEEKDVLPRAFRFIVENNSSNAAPYHSLHHMLRVTHYCSAGCLYHNITGSRRTMLLTAAMFHDFNHSQGKEKDDKNIKRALDGLSEFYLSNPLNRTNTDLNTMFNIIRATEYPYVIPAEELTLEQSIIRDADLMPSLEVDWINTMIVGLKEELNVESFLDMVEGQSKFHSGIEMCSEWGKSIYKERWGEVFENLELMRSLL